MSSLGAEIFDRFIQREKFKEIKQMEAKILKKQQDYIYKILPAEKTITDRESIKYIQDRTNLDEETIVNGLNNLIKKSKVISVYDKYQNVYVIRIRIS